MGFGAQQSLAIDQLWAAFEGSEKGALLASVLIVPCAGRTAITFLSPVAAAQEATVHATLVRQAVAAIDVSKTRLAQALLESHHYAQADVFVQAGFQRLAHLVYMQRPITAQHIMPLELEPELEISTWAPSRRKLFEDAITASYEQTMDCPGLLGLRDVGDVLDGHMATGEFHPSLWMALHRGNEPIGVLLLNLVMQRQNLELVYLGLAKAWRGKHLGRKLMHHAVRLAQEHHVGHLVLAVDELNVGALKLYRSMGFAATVRKLALVKVTNEETKRRRDGETK